MFKNYLKSSLRHFWKNKFFSFVNLMGLSVGLAAALAIILHVMDELSYETHHERANRIVRVNVEASFDGTEMKLATAPNQAAPFLKEQLPEVEEALRVFPHNFGESASISIGNQNFVETDLYWADPNLFKVFSIPLLMGNPETALNRTNTLILSQSTANRYFGADNPIGKTIRIDNRYDMEVTGIFKDQPSNSNLTFNVIGTFQTVPFGKPENLSWGNASFYTFLLLHQGISVTALENKIAEISASNIPEDNQWFQFKLKPLLAIHLYSKGIQDTNAQYGDITQVWVLIGLAILLLFIACINYMNLATAKSEQRSKEVAISKTLGATSQQMALQFFMETGLLVLIGLSISLLLLFLALPYFNELANKDLKISDLWRPGFLVGLFGAWAIISLVAGAYPALFLSSFSPNYILKQHRQEGFSAVTIRKGLVIFQFCVSIVLIVSTLLLYQQLNFISSKKLGYDPEQVVAIRVMGIQPRSNIEALEKELQQLPTVVSTSLSQSYPGHSASGRSLYRPNDPEGQGADLTSCRAHPGILNVLDLKLIAGRSLKVQEEGDSVAQVVLNKSAIDYLGWTPEEAIGKRVDADLGTSEIVGVVEDFHFSSLHQKIGYYAFHNRNSEWLQYLLVKLKTQQLSETMQHIKNTFEKVTPTTALEYTFLDESLDRLYRTEQRLAKVVFIFAGLAILIACLGLFALAAFATERRIKEIGIRKVLGASSMSIVRLLSIDFLKLVVVAFLLASPIAWYVMNRWLEDFAYRIDIRWWVFLVAGAVAVLITLLTVSLQSLKAALANPVESLKVE
ncbi:MAG: ABC transporter permease [Saprospiraceae bacterium]